MVGSVDPAGGVEAGEHAVALAGQQIDRAPVVLEVGKRGHAGGLGARIDAPGRSRGAQRRGQGGLGDGVPEAQTGEAPVLGHRVQHQQVAGGQQVGLPLRLRQQVAVGLVEDEERRREARDKGGDQRRRQRRPGGVVGRAEPAEAGALVGEGSAKGGLVAEEARPAAGVDQPHLLQPRAGQPRGDLALAERRCQRDCHVAGYQGELRDQADQLRAAVAADHLRRIDAVALGQPCGKLRRVRVRIGVDDGACDRSRHARRRPERRLVGAEVGEGGGVDALGAQRRRVDGAVHRRSHVAEEGRRRQLGSQRPTPGRVRTYRSSSSR